MKMITPISDSIFKKLNEEELLLINELYLDMVKYKNVIDKIKEEVLSELQMCKPKEMALSMEIYYIGEKLEKLLEEVDG